MTDRMAIVPRTELTAASPNAGKLSPAQITAAVDAMADCDLPYLPRARREIFARAVAKAWGLEIA